MTARPEPLACVGNPVVNIAIVLPQLIELLHVGIGADISLCLVSP